MNSEFAYYLAGLIEGDGSIITPPIYSVINPVIKIVFAEKDLPLANKINSCLIDDKLYKAKGRYYTFTFNKLDTNLLILNLINGKMRTPKINALYKLIDWFNLTKNTKILKLGLDYSNLDKNSWLSGLLDTDGSFTASYSLNKENIINGIWCYMRISQKQSYNYYSSNLNKENNMLNNNVIKSDSNLDIMNRIKDYLKVKNVKRINRERISYTELGYEIRTTKIDSNLILINYLTHYPLFSSKYLDYLDWKKIIRNKNK